MFGTVESSDFAAGIIVGIAVAVTMDFLSNAMRWADKRVEERANRKPTSPSPPVPQ